MLSTRRSTTSIHTIPTPLLRLQRRPGAETAGINLTLDVGGSISGTLRDAANNPLAFASISASPTSCCASSGSAFSAADGTFSVGGLAAGGYHVSASASRFVTGYYNGVQRSDLASTVIVALGANSPSINISLAREGKITGVVKNDANIPIAGAFVLADEIECCVANGRGTATTGADGTYEITGLAAVPYRVSVGGGGYAPEFFNNVYDQDDANPVSVLAGATTGGINFNLAVGGSISGVVKHGAAPIANAQVGVESSPCCAGSGQTATQADGSYVIAGLPPGDYEVNVTAAGYIGEYYDDATEADATLVAVTLGIEHAGIDFDLAIAEGSQAS